VQSSRVGKSVLSSILLTQYLKKKNPRTLPEGIHELVACRGLNYRLKVARLSNGTHASGVLCLTPLFPGGTPEACVPQATFAQPSRILRANRA